MAKPDLRDETDRASATAQTNNEAVVSFWSWELNLIDSTAKSTVTDHSLKLWTHFQRLRAILSLSVFNVFDMSVVWKKLQNAHVEIYKTFKKYSCANTDVVRTTFEPFLSVLLPATSWRWGQRSGTVSRILSGTRQSALTLSDVCWRRICLRDTSACSVNVCNCEYL